MCIWEKLPDMQMLPKLTVIIINWELITWEIVAKTEMTMIAMTMTFQVV